MKAQSKRFVQLGEKLASIAEMDRYNHGEHKEAWALAHSFLDLEESFNKFTQEYLPKLENAVLNNEDTVNLLLDIGEVFRHILYHINSLKFYEYLSSDEKK